MDLAQPLGWLIGVGIVALLAEGLSSELYRIPLTVEPSTHATASLVSVGAAVLSAFIVRRRIDRFDLISVSPWVPAKDEPLETVERVIEAGEAVADRVEQVKDALDLVVNGMSVEQLAATDVHQAGEFFIVCVAGDLADARRGEGRGAADLRGGGRRRERGPPPA